MRALKLLVAAVVLALLAAPASAGPFTKVWVFGDSSVDAGWYKISPWSGISDYDTYFQQSATYGFGKATTNPGRISVQELAYLLGRQALPANQGGTDYGTGGARNHEFNLSGSGLFLNAVPTETQIDNYLLTHTPTGEGLYVISSGDNDIGYALKNPDNVFGDPNVIGLPAVQANELAYVVAAADSLASKIAGAHTNNSVNFVIVTKLAESFGNPAFKQTLRAAYNAKLKGQLDALGVTYAWADVDSVRLQVNANPGAYGIDSQYLTPDPGHRACTEPDPQLNVSTGFAFLCSRTSPVSQPMSAAIAKEAMFSDDQHFATGGHNVIGSYYYCLARQTWPKRFKKIGKHQPPIPCSTFFPSN